jgi:hypothetical protein
LIFSPSKFEQIIYCKRLHLMVLGVGKELMRLPRSVGHRIVLRQR